MFLKTTIIGVVYLLVYVDNIVITGSDAAETEAVITRFHTEFKLKDLGALK